MLFVVVVVFNTQAALQTGKLPVLAKSHVVQVTGFADRHLLSKEILEFCGVLPIYNTRIWDSSYDASNNTASKLL